MKLRWLALLFLLLAPPVIRAQETSPSWEVLFYVSADKSIVRLSAEGEINRIPVPIDTSQFTDIHSSLSPDHRWLAVQDGREANRIYVADLQSQTCCIVVGDHFVVPDDPKSSFSLKLIGFDPTSSQFAFMYIYGCDDSAVMCYPSASVAFIDLETSKVRVIKDFKVIFTLDPVTWDQRGLVFLDNPLCMEGDFCTGVLRVGSLKIYDDSNMKLKFASPRVFYALNSTDAGDYLPASDEYIAPYAYQPYGDESAIVCPVVVYYQPKMKQNDWIDKPYLVSVSSGCDAQDLRFAQTHWVNNGQMVLITPYITDKGEYNLLLDRNSHQTIFNLERNQQFFAGTPDGWLMYSTTQNSSNESSINLYFYQLENNEVVSRKLASYRTNRIGDVILLQAPMLQGNIERGFPSVPAPKTLG